MPKGSLIIGVDLMPIKPLPHVIAFQADITTPKCRNELRQHMHDWKADLVLHDGAPNVGAAWVQDAFSQNELVLQSLRLATEFLVKGGNFVTKVFRSQDYNSLMWVFNQLFRHVEATKPPSSRNVSAEIFVVCRDFIAPKHIDPKFLDPKHVFKDLQSSLPASITEAPAEEASTAATMASTAKAANAAARLAATNNHAHANVYAPEKKRRQREGYADGDYTLFHKASASDFVRGDPVAILGTMNKIAFETEEEKEWLKSRHTTPDIVSNFEDLKVLGKGDFKALMKWRLAIRLEIGLDVKASKTEEATEDVEVEEMDEEQQISEELKRLHEEKRAKQKREKKRKNEIKTKTIQKLQLGMTAPTDLDMDDRELAGEEMFDLGEGERENRTGRSIEDAVRDADGMSESEESEVEQEEDDDEVLSSDEERERRTAALEGTLDDLYDSYKERKSEQDAKWKVKQQRLKDRNYDAWHGIQEGSDSEDDGVDKGYRSGMVRVPRRGDADEEEEESEGEGGWDVVANQKAQDYDSDSDSDSEAEDDADAPKKKKAKVTIRDPRPVAQPQQKKLLTSLSRDDSRDKMSRQAQVWFDQSVFKDMGDLAALDGDDEDEDEEMDEDHASDDDSVDSEGDVDMGSDESTLEAPEDDDDFEIVPQEVDEDPEWDVDDEDQDEVLQRKIKEKGILTAEAQTLANRLVNREVTASQLIDEGFNKLSTHNKDGLPSWFLDDESKHYRPNIPITKEAVQALRDRQRALDARPIKKIAEAKGRKKMKAAARLERAKKKAAGVMETEDLNDGEKARQVSRLLRRAAAGEKRQERKVVVAKGVNKGVKGRPKGVKGKYKIVDARMRKEVRAQKRIAKRDKGKKRK